MSRIQTRFVARLRDGHTYGKEGGMTVQIHEAKFFVTYEECRDWISENPGYFKMKPMGMTVTPCPVHITVLEPCDC